MFWRGLALKRLEPDLGAQARSVAELLPYETVLEDLERPVVVLDGGSLGLVWELQPLEHEVLPNAQLEQLCGALAGTVQAIVDPDVVFQVISESRPGWTFEGPSWLTTPETTAQDVVAHRVEAIRSRAGRDAPAARTMARKVYLTLRLQGSALKSRWRFLPESVDASLDRRARALAERVARLAEHAQVVEDGLMSAGWQIRRCDASAVLELLRVPWHDEDALQQGAATLPFNPERRLAEQVATGFCRMAPHGVQVGRDTWEAISWLDQPPQVYFGLFALLLELRTPHRMVVNVRPCLRDGDLAISAQVLKPATDERGVRHREELQEVERRRAFGEQLVCVSVHLFVCSEGVDLDTVAQDGVGRTLATRLSVVSRVPFVHEETFASGLVILCQPLAYTPDAGGKTFRERRVLTGALGPYLPVFGGYSGTLGGSFAPRRVHTQLVVSRAGDPIWLSCRDASTAPHLAVLASTGGGKSFYMANLMTAELAAHPDSLIFIIDAITSYRVFGEVMGADRGFTFVRPPESFPNIFLGELDEIRVQVIVGILCTAITLEDAHVRLTSEHRQLLAAALNKAAEDALLDAGTAFEDGQLAEREGVSRRVPRLSNVVDNLVSEAERLQLSVDTAMFLRNKLGAYYGHGAYARFFDQDAVQGQESPTPQVTLYDLERVAGDPVLATLSMVCCIAEILRHIRRPENRGRKGMLVVDEAGVLAANSAELERFIKDAWKTFRKLGYICAGLTNEVDDFREKAGPRTMWANSPNKVILRLSSTEAEKLGLADESRGIPRLVSDPHLQKLAASLRMSPGVYSQGLWIAEGASGTWLYEPTGYDYWLAASRPEEVESFTDCAYALGGPRSALHWLVEHHPYGIRDAHGDLIPFHRDMVAPVLERAGSKGGA